MELVRHTMNRKHYAVADTLEGFRRVFKSRVPVFIGDVRERAIPHDTELPGSEGFRRIERFPPASSRLLAFPTDPAS